MSRLLAQAALLAAMPQAFIDPLLAPGRNAIQSSAGEARGERTLLTMPAVRPGGISVVKVVGVGSRGLSSHMLVFDPDGGLLAVIEAHQLTARRTAAASVLAARAVGAGSARQLAIIGAGRQAYAHVEAFAAALPLDALAIWARRSEAAEALADFARGFVPRVRVAPSPGDAVKGAQIISCVTASRAPLIHGGMIAAGAHVDLVGGFRPNMREADDTLMARAAVVIDTPVALEEAGDLLAPIASGALDRGSILTLADILSGRALAPGREVTVFKSVGHAGEDLVAAELLLERLGLLDCPATASGHTEELDLGGAVHHA